MKIDNTLYESCLRERLREKGYVCLVKPTIKNGLPNTFGLPDLFDTDRRDRCKLLENTYTGYIKINKNETSFILVITGDCLDISSVRSLKRYILEEIGWKYHNFHVVTVYFTNNYAKLSYASDIDTVIVYQGKVVAKKVYLRRINRLIVRDLLEIHAYAIARCNNITKTSYEGFTYFGGYKVTVVFWLILILAMTYARANVLNLSGTSVSSVLYQNNWLSLISAIFVHANLMHLLGNIIALWYIGSSFESNVGSLKTFIVFFASGVLGNLISVAYKFDTFSSVELVGASGAIFGLLGGLVVINSYDFNAQRLKIKHLLITLGISIIYIWFCGTSSSSIDNPCHIGGFISGILITLITECIARYLDYNAVGLTSENVIHTNRKYALSRTDDLSKVQILNEEERHNLSRLDGHRKIRF